MKKLLLLLALVLTLTLNAQITWDGGAGTTSWNDADNWNPNGVPTSSDDVEFNSQTLTITFSSNSDARSLTFINSDITFEPAAATNRRLRLNNGTPALTIDATSTLTLDGASTGAGNSRMRLNFLNSGTVETGTISGTINLNATGSGGQMRTAPADLTFTATAVINHRLNGDQLPTGTYDAGSTVNVTGIVGNNATNTNQTFGNFTWNCPSQTGNRLLAAGFNTLGTFKIENTGAGRLRSPNGATMTVDEFEMTGGAFQLRANNANTNPNLIVNSQYTQTGGVFVVSNQNIANSTLTIGGNFTQTGGILRRANGTSTVLISGAVNHVFTTAGGTVDGQVDFSVDNSAELSFAAPTTTILGSGDFSLASGAEINISSADGIAESAASGHIQVTGTRTFNAGATYNYVANGAQETGDGLPDDVTGSLIVSSTTVLSPSKPFGVTGTFTNNGEVVFEDDDTFISTGTTIGGTGDVTVLRNLSTNKIWYELSFPVTSGTVADLNANWPIRTTTTHPTQPSFWNVYRWDAATANWEAAASTTPLNEKSLKIYAFGTGLNISVTIPNANFNNSDLAQVLAYNDGQSSTFLTGTLAETEGWNIHFNPFQDFMDWNAVEPVLSGDSRFTNTGVAVKDNTGSYQYYNGGVGTARYIAPQQGFWVQCNSSVAAATTLTYTNAMRTTTPGSPVSSFKTATAVPVQLGLKVSGAQGDAYTHLAVNPNATSTFDAAQDMRWFAGEHTQFYSTDANGTKYGINQSSTMGTAPVPVEFASNNTGASFTITADLSNWDNSIKVIVKDKYLGKRQRLTKKRGYTFVNAAGAPADRFEIRFKYKAPTTKTGLDDGLDEPINAWFNNQQLHLDAGDYVGTGRITVYTVAGQLVKDVQLETMHDARLTINGPTGMYIVKVDLEGTEYDQVLKVVK